MQATLKAGKLTIVIEAEVKSPPLSASGKTHSVASSHGNKPTGVKLPDGREIIVGLNAYVYPA